jgi:serine/threonine-protein kinase ATR
MPDDVTQSEKQQCGLLSAFARIACAGSGSLEGARVDSHDLKLSNCTVCDGPSSASREGRLYWNEAAYGEDWKDAIAAMLVITKEPRFDQTPKARVYMALAIGRVFRHISDVDYLYLEACELGQWLATSMSRSLREHKLAAT